MTTAEPASAADLDRTGESPSVLRSEEQLRVGVRTQAVGRLRIRKRVVTEEVTRTVTVRREELVVEEEPVEPGVGADHQVGDRDLEIVLHEEQVEVHTVVVPVERVVVRVRRVEGSAAVAEVVRRERVDLEQDPR
ncbi:conserved domain-containing protein [Friedmanniella luteola]|uniref:Conserved domain-containing protein n=1 Tax=Friedmanniella luteola TaxID=546871 RepID=A0A1H1LK02_9ACTN|nr:DUF2382 domain-containing protein [Friedmanniella luteola]SDR74345.1 conserved domain-containing protein [Friedmanniella luteola]